MKINYFGLTALILLAFGVLFVGSANAQIYVQDGDKVTKVGQQQDAERATEPAIKKMSAQERYERFGQGLVNPVEMSEKLAKGETPPAAMSQGYGPGDQPEYNITFSSGHWQRPDEDFTPILVSKTSVEGKRYVSCRVFPTGDSGRYDGTHPIGYINPVFDFNGEISNPRPFKTYHLFTRKVNRELKKGTAQFDCSVWNESGVLVQQLWMDIYNTDSGPAEPRYSIDRVVKGKGGYTIYGNLPCNIETFYLMGILNYGGVTNGTDPAYAPKSTDCKSLFIPGVMNFVRMNMGDVAIWNPYTRQVIVLAKGIKERPVRENLP